MNHNLICSATSYAQLYPYPNLQHDKVDYIMYVYIHSKNSIRIWKDITTIRGYRVELVELDTDVYYKKSKVNTCICACSRIMSCDWSDYVFMQCRRW